VRLVAIGDELLDGHTRETNGRELIRYLDRLGLRVAELLVVRDSEEELGGLARSRGETPAELTISTGGLGPTLDDRTRGILAQAFGAELVFDEERWARIVERYRALGREPGEESRNQALHPRPGFSLPNGAGTADALGFEERGRLWIALPGVPSEMRHLMEMQVLPLLEKRYGSRSGGRVLSYRTRGLPEALLHERLKPHEDLLRLGEPGFYPHPEGVLFRLRLPPLHQEEEQRRTEEAGRLVRERLGEHLLCESGEDLLSLVSGKLRQRCLTLGLAESCTGGLLALQITDLPGSSEVFRGGLVAYSNAIKSGLLGVPEELLAEAGAVSADCVGQMARGARDLLGCDLALSVSGIAGPGGGTPDKPVGTVWLGLALPGETQVRLLNLPGNREQIRLRAAGRAWLWLYEILTRVVDPPAGQEKNGE